MNKYDFIALNAFLLAHVRRISAGTSRLSLAGAVLAAGLFAFGCALFSCGCGCGWTRVPQGSVTAYPALNIFSCIADRPVGLLLSVSGIVPSPYDATHKTGDIPCSLNRGACTDLVGQHRLTTNHGPPYKGPLLFTGGMGLFTQLFPF